MHYIDREYVKNMQAVVLPYIIYIINSIVAFMNLCKILILNV